MVFVSKIAEVVFKRTGGRLWNKPWGLPKVTQTRKANRRRANNLIRQNQDVLKEAAAKDPQKLATAAATSDKN